jgi:cis-3-alkyl-4-acyloxetan-2-one decarboxylase
MLTEPILPQIPDSLRKLYPFRTRTFAIDGQKISFVDEGAAEAPALVLLHGNPTWSFLYRKSISKLAERFRVIAPDHVGFGLSDKPVDPGYHTLERHVANLTALIEALKLEKITFTLHDWGGPIGLGYATAHPENVARILLMNTWGAPPPPGTKLKLPLPLRILRSKLGEWLVRKFNVMVKRGIPSASYRPISPEVMAGYELPFADPGSRTAMTAFERMIPLKPGDAAYGKLAEIAAGLKNIQGRVEILWGARDPVFRSKLPAYMLRDRFPNSAEPLFLENASHFVPEDAPEQITDKLLEIFKPKPVKPQQTFNILP